MAYLMKPVVGQGVTAFHRLFLTDATDAQTLQMIPIFLH